MTPEPEPSPKALLLAALFSAAVWAVVIAALARAFRRDIIP